MGISLSGIGTVGKEQLISSCSNGEPNWLYIPTKGKSSKTHAEFVSEIKELARRAATTANKTEYEYISRQVLGLRDRKSTRLNSSHQPQSRMPSSA